MALVASVRVSSDRDRHPSAEPRSVFFAPQTALFCTFSMPKGAVVVGLTDEWTGTRFTSRCGRRERLVAAGRRDPGCPFPSVAAPRRLRPRRRFGPADCRIDRAWRVRRSPRVNLLPDRECLGVGARRLRADPCRWPADPRPRAATRDQFVASSQAPGARDHRRLRGRRPRSLTGVRV
jgi:hypothetical protein